ncbi:hypothetical protein SMACR_09147 [Sordaria macrospora]|uniref:WGS project CABT00000000 data, contig 2.43 n=2 Tax=Sordaria macrospora TaxID=5147 RepID=F7W8A1_SORMK|nr:uncharacterized protein SMAC_09147 [Sordaria macrospora k-hell]KAA8631807.1 hypothetical protein SMACR_09147 [Sordaria macrospora]KAH7632444.1 hypothetical protein B0T09DRAFT_259045 [Sordaria sp. MPI-SDFR-AT-0083]WPJ61063.1 hypothetical protein SMAC4_09147 [Sordaria macrospora]CCC13746.1 unnamed protein product [Sordaria macrospora k-hell]
MPSSKKKTKTTAPYKTETVGCRSTAPGQPGALAGVSYTELFTHALQGFEDSQFSPVLKAIQFEDWEQLPTHTVAVRRGDLANPDARCDKNDLVVKEKYYGLIWNW